MVSTRQIKHPRRSHRNELPAHEGSSSKRLQPTPRLRSRSEKASPKSTTKSKRPTPIETVDDTRETPEAQATKIAELPPSFLLSITVRHKHHVIHQQASMRQADTYSFAAYMVTEATKVSDWATKKKIQLVRRSRTATISCDGKSTKPISTHVNDPDDYKAAEGIAVAWAIEGKKRVRLVVDVVYDLEEEDEEGEEGDSVHSENEEPQPKKARKATTEKLLEQSQERQEASAAQTNIPTLIRHWRCEDPQCPNNGKPCCIIEGKHHTIMSNQLSVWDRSIAIGNATLHSPPPGMVFHPVVKARPALPAAAQAPPVFGPPPPYAIAPAYGWAPPYLPPPVPPILPAAAAPAAAPITDPSDILAEYIEWTARKMPKARVELENARQALLEEYHDIEGLQTFSDGDWELLGIPIGLGRRLARDARVYKHKRRNRHSN